MVNLEVKERMSSLQLGIAVTASLLTARLLPATSHIVGYSQQFLWLSSALAGLLFYSAACLMIRLGEQYPNETIGEYVSRLAGARLGLGIFLLLSLIFLFNIVNNIIAISALSSIFLFDRTPPEAVELVLLLGAAYGAWQEWGTVLRVIQMMILALPILYLFYSSIWLNFEPLNLLPLWPDNVIGILKGVFYHTDYYAGYESLLILLPLTRPGKLSFYRTIGWGFLVITIIYVLGGIVLIGSVTAKTVESVKEPVVYAMKSVELPGTFIERMENYMIMLFIPVTYLAIMLNYFVLAEGWRKYLHYNDHRPLIPAVLPLVFFACVFLDNPQKHDTFRNVSMIANLFFSFVIIPMLLYAAGRKKKDGAADDGQNG